MVRLTSKLKTWAEEYLKDSDVFLIDIENKPGSSKYRVLIDGIEPVSIKECADLSRHLSKLIDEDSSIRDDAFFTFDVSSPGADAPLKFLKQFPKHIGKKFNIQENNGIELTGVLEAIEGEMLHLNCQLSKKEVKKETIDFNNIKEAKIIVSFK